MIADTQYKRNNKKHQEALDVVEQFLASGGKINKVGKTKIPYETTTSKQLSLRTYDARMRRKEKLNTVNDPTLQSMEFLD